jgi:hypothetical protein
MLLSPLQQALWALYALATASVVVTLAYKRLISVWPSLFALCTVQILTTAFLFTFRHHYAWYFYGYWTSSPIQSALRLWLLSEIIGKIPGTSFISQKFRLIVMTAGLIMGLVAGWGAHFGSIPWIASSQGHKHQILEAILLYDRSVSFFCLACCVSATTIIYLIGLGWSGPAPMLVSTLSIQLTAFTLSSLLYGYFHNLKSYAELFDEAVRIVVLCLWTHAIFRSHPMESRVPTP